MYSRRLVDASATQKAVTAVARLARDEEPDVKVALAPNVKHCFAKATNISSCLSTGAFCNS